MLSHLLLGDFTTWGIGIYSEMPIGKTSSLERRWFFICEFTRNLMRTVIVSSGDNANLVDAIAAGPFAVERGAPILLTQNNRIPAETSAKLTEIGPTEIIVVGGAILPGVVDALHAFAPKVTWLKGPNRYATAGLLA